jgi:hypothetical protein
MSAHDVHTTGQMCCVKVNCLISCSVRSWVWGNMNGLMMLWHVMGAATAQKGCWVALELSRGLWCVLFHASSKERELASVRGTECQNTTSTSVTSQLLHGAAFTADYWTRQGQGSAV